MAVSWLMQWRQDVINGWLDMNHASQLTYNVDPTHQCVTPLARRGRVDPVTRIGANIYGCRMCGRTHICRVDHIRPGEPRQAPDPDEPPCPAVENSQGDGAWCCGFTGGVLLDRSSYTVASFDDSVDVASRLLTAEQEGALGTEHQLAATVRDAQRDARRSEFLSDHHQRSMAHETVKQAKTLQRAAAMVESMEAAAAAGASAGDAPAPPPTPPPKPATPLYFAHVGETAGAADDRINNGMRYQPLATRDRDYWDKVGDF